MMQASLICLFLSVAKYLISIFPTMALTAVLKISGGRRNRNFSRKTPMIYIWYCTYLCRRDDFPNLLQVAQLQNGDKVVGYCGTEALLCTCVYTFDISRLGLHFVTRKKNWISRYIFNKYRNLTDSFGTGEKLYRIQIAGFIFIIDRKWRPWRLLFGLYWGFNLPKVWRFPFFDSWLIQISYCWS